MKMTYIKPEMVCNSVATSGFVAVSTKEIPGVEDNTDPLDVAEAFDCCMRIGNGDDNLTNTEAANWINQNLNKCLSVEEWTNDAECNCWLTKQYFKIIKIDNKYYYQEYDSRRCTTSSTNN